MESLTVLGILALFLAIVATLLSPLGVSIGKIDERPLFDRRWVLIQFVRAGYSVSVLVGLGLLVIGGLSFEADLVAKVSLSIAVLLAFVDAVVTVVMHKTKRVRVAVAAVVHLFMVPLFLSFGVLTLAVEDVDILCDSSPVGSCVYPSNRLANNIRKLPDAKLQSFAEKCSLPNDQEESCQVEITANRITLESGGTRFIEIERASPRLVPGGLAFAFLILLGRELYNIYVRLSPPSVKGTRFYAIESSGCKPVAVQAFGYREAAVKFARESNKCSAEVKWLLAEASPVDTRVGMDAKRREKAERRESRKSREAAPSAEITGIDVSNF